MIDVIPFLFFCAMKYDAIIFDLGGVIINLDYQRTIIEFEKLGVSNFNDLYNQAAQSQVFDDYETGRISSQHFINKLLDFLPQGTSPNQVVRAWNAMILDVPSEKLKLLQTTKAQLPIYLLSNTNEIHMDKVRREWAKSSYLPVEDYFSNVYLSYEMNLRKPDAEIFKMVCELNALQPEKVLFIDDSIQHIQGASSIGLNTHHLTRSEDLYTLFS